MLISPTRRAPWEPHHSAESLSRPKCPRCRSTLLVAEESRFSATGRIDHDWLCDDCGNVRDVDQARTHFSARLKGDAQTHDHDNVILSADTLSASGLVRKSQPKAPQRR